MVWSKGICRSIDEKRREGSVDIRGNFQSVRRIYDVVNLAGDARGPM